jgi:hypothetical protein
VGFKTRALRINIDEVLKSPKKEKSGALSLVGSWELVFYLPNS